jgi:hypothetical protein
VSAGGSTDRFVCVDCGELAPPEDDPSGGTSSLLTLQYGWRIRRRIDGDGVTHIEARCSPCNARFKRDGGHRTISSLPPRRFVHFAHPPEELVETTHFRSSWLNSSLRERGYFEGYVRGLPASFHDVVLASVAGTWLPIDVAIAHYAAVDALSIPAATIFEMGRQVQDHAQSIIAPLALRAARDLGVTPWFIFGQFRKIWDRTWRGGDFAIDKIGPKEADLEIVGWTVAGSAYIRNALRGVFDGMLGACCERVYIQEAPPRTRRALRFRFNWV